jgi:hypothetical protein
MSHQQNPSPLPDCLQQGRDLGWREPLDERDLTTRLESEGVTDSVAAAEYGFQSARHMAEEWLPRVLTYGPAVEPPAPKRKWFREYLDGVAFSLPLLCACISTLWLGFALWGGDMPNEDAVAVGLGTVGSFLLTGGAAQALVRRGLFLSTTRQPELCLKVVRYWMACGFLVVAAGSAALAAASEYWQWLPLRANLVATAFSVALGGFWLGGAALYVLGRSAWMAWIHLAGIAAVWVLHVALGTSLIAAQLSSILACAAASVVSSLRRFDASADQKLAPSIPWCWAREIYQVWPFVLYGILYYLLLFGDRLVSWTADTHATPLNVQFRGDYETAINVGLILFVLLAGWVHCGTGAFYSRITAALGRHTVSAISSFRRECLHFYRSQLARLAVLTMVTGCLTYGGAQVAGLLADDSAALICFWSLAGFAMLATGIWHVNLLFALSSPGGAVVSAAAGCLANLLAGYFLSRLGGYEFAVYGFFAGAAVFAASSAVFVHKAFRNVDYRYCALAG